MNGVPNPRGRGKMAQPRITPIFRRRPSPRLEAGLSKQYIHPAAELSFLPRGRERALPFQEERGSQGINVRKRSWDGTKSGLYRRRRLMGKWDLGWEEGVG